MNFVYRILDAVLTAVYILIIARAIGSFFIRDWSRGLPRFLWDVTEPILSPVRRILPPMAGLDLSPMVVILAVYFIQLLLRRSAVSL